MVEAFGAAEIVIDLSVALAAVALGVVFSPRVRGTRLWFPLMLLCGGVAVFEAFDAFEHLAASAGDLALSFEFERAAQIGIGLSMPALVNLVAVYPRNIRVPQVRFAVGSLYVLGMAFAALAPTRFLLEPAGQLGGSEGPVYGVAYWPLLIPLVGGVLVALGWTLFLTFGGASENERRTGAMMSLMVGAPVLLGAAAPGFGIHEIGPFDTQGVAHAIWLAAMVWVVMAGRLAPPIHSTFYGLLNSFGEAVFIVGRDGEVVQFNKQAERLVGKKPEEIAFRPLGEVLAGVSGSPEHAAFTETLVKGVLRGRMDSHEGLLVGKGDPPRSYRLRVQPLGKRDASQESEMAILMLFDDTSRRADEVATTRSRDVLDLVIRMLGHDLKAPLTVIQGYIDIDRAAIKSAKGPEDLATVPAHLDKISEAIVGMQVLMGNARAISRLAAAGGSAPAVTEIDLGRLVVQTTDALRPMAAARNVVVKMAVADGISAAVVAGFDSVPRNLLDNAIKYSRPGGEVEVSLSQGEGRILLSVADTGPGIPPEKLDQLFQKFERLGAEKGSTEGHGLGLSIVAKLVELSKGTVRAMEREDGRTGAVFVVELPRPAASTPERSSTSSFQAGS